MIRLVWAALLVQHLLATGCSWASLCCGGGDASDENVWDEIQFRMPASTWQFVARRFLGEGVSKDVLEKTAQAMAESRVEPPLGIESNMAHFNYVWRVMQWAAAQRAAAIQRLDSAPEAERRALAEAKERYMTVYRALLLHGVVRHMPEKKQWLVILLREALESRQRDVVDVLLGFAANIRETLAFTADSDVLYVHGLRAGHRRLLDALTVPHGALVCVQLRGQTLLRVLREATVLFAYMLGESECVSADGRVDRELSNASDGMSGHDSPLGREGSLSSDHFNVTMTSSPARSTAVEQQWTPVQAPDTLQMVSDPRPTDGQRALLAWVEELVRASEAAVVARAMELAYELIADASDMAFAQPQAALFAHDAGLACLCAREIATRVGAHAEVTARQATIAAALVDRLPGCASVTGLARAYSFRAPREATRRAVAAVKAVGSAHSLRGRALAGDASRVSASPRTQAAERIVLADDAQRDFLVGCACVHCGNNLLDEPPHATRSVVPDANLLAQAARNARAIYSRLSSGDDDSSSLALQDVGSASFDHDIARPLGVQPEITLTEDIESPSAQNDSEDGRQAVRTSAKLMATVDVELAARRSSAKARRGGFIRRLSSSSRDAAPRGARVFPTYGSAAAYVRHEPCGARYHEACWARVAAAEGGKCVLCGRVAVDSAPLR